MGQAQIVGKTYYFVPATIKYIKHYMPYSKQKLSLRKACVLRIKCATNESKALGTRFIIKRCAGLPQVHLQDRLDDSPNKTIINI